MSNIYYKQQVVIGPLSKFISGFNDFIISDSRIKRSCELLVCAFGTKFFVMIGWFTLRLCSLMAEFGGLASGSPVRNENPLCSETLIDNWRDVLPI